MPATPRMQKLARAVRVRHPDVGSMGVYNPRHIGSNRFKPWSQHAGCEPARGWYGNAWDITSPSILGPRVPSNPDHMAYLDLVYGMLYANREKLHVNALLWRRPDHWDHIHVDTWPKMADNWWRTHPTKGGPVITIDKDGTRRNTYYIPEEDDMVIQQGDRGSHVRRIQRWVNNSPSAPDPPLVDDGIFGPATEAAIRDYQVRRAFDSSGVVDGITYADLTLWKS